jgi:hypothetical protein
MPHLFLPLANKLPVLVADARAREIFALRCDERESFEASVVEQAAPACLQEERFAISGFEFLG